MVVSDRLTPSVHNGLITTACTAAVIAGLAGCSSPEFPSYRLELPASTNVDLAKCVTMKVGNELRSRDIERIEVVRDSRWISYDINDRLNKFEAGRWEELFKFEVSFKDGARKESTVLFEYAPPGAFGWKLQAGAEGFVPSVPEQLTMDLRQQDVCSVLVEYLAAPVIGKLSRTAENSGI